MMVVILRSNVDPEMEAAFRTRMRELQKRAEEAPGFRSFREFTAEDGEVLMLVEFDREEQLAAWRNQTETLRTQQQGRDHFFRDYTLQVCREVRRSEFSR